MTTPRRDTRGLRRCRDCSEVIRQTITLHGKVLYVDPDPVVVAADDPDPWARGNVAAYLDALTVWRSRVLRKGETPLHAEKRFMPHIATCTKRSRPQPARAVQAPPAAPPADVPRLDDYRRRRAETRNP